LAIIEQLFDHVPDTAFFIKDARGRYIAVNQSLVERCGCRDKKELLGRHVQEIFPKSCRTYARQDQTVIALAHDYRSFGIALVRASPPGWCLTTKLPMRNHHGVIVGVAESPGIARPGDREASRPAWPAR
jgi:PAS domain-containing protein